MSTITKTQLSAGTWAIDPVHSSVAFAVRHLMVSSNHGTFRNVSGAITAAEDGTPSVSAEIEVGSVDTGNAQRDGHIKSADMFDVDSFPTATFTSTAVTEDLNGYVIDGDFTLRGVTKRIALSLVFTGVSPGMVQGEVTGFRAFGCVEPQGLRYLDRHAAARRGRRAR